MDREGIVARARACLGARFRVHGRDPAYGFDCVGVAAAAFGRAVAGDYALRGGEAAAVQERIDATGLRTIDPRMAGMGALVLTDEGHGQLHLAVLSADGFIHAHAGLMRVVETPGRPARIVAAWDEGEG